MCAAAMWKSAMWWSARRWSFSADPRMLIGLGGGAASSVGSGQSSSDLDFASVQRANAEMQRRAQEVIDRCWAQGAANPILLIHDVGAGGLSNALPEAIAHSRRGGRIDLRKIPSAESGLSPMEIWCNEAQERYVLALAPGSVERFAALCERERCPFAVVGEITGDGRMRVIDPLLSSTPVDMPIEVLLGKAPRMTRTRAQVPKGRRALSTADATIADSLDRLLCLPTIADKSFLITIGDRTVGGMISRDQMVGPWQVPVADVAVSLSGFEGYGGEAMAMGERAPVALLNAPASGRLAVGGGDHQYRRGRYPQPHRHTPLGELDGRLRRAGRGCGPARHGARGRHGVVRHAWHHDSGGQGFAVDAHRVDRCATARTRSSRRCRWSSPRSLRSPTRAAR